MSNTIWLEHNVNEGIGKQVSEIGRIIEKAKTCPNEIEIDFTNIKFIQPTTILGVSSLQTTYNSVGKTCNTVNLNEDTQSYFDAVVFPGGIFPDLDPDWSQKIESYKNKNYIPIINFPTDRRADSVFIRNSVLSKLNEILAFKLGYSIAQIGPVSYFISEFTDNIVEHAGVSRAKILVQYFPIKGFVEICIIDEGKTILGSYKNHNTYFPENDRDAITFAINGKSTKSPERGYGIPSSSNLIVNGLKGSLCLVSGTAMLANKVITNYSSDWRGTLLSVKIPKNFDQINMHNYI
jgi:anti-sigma regulatory factor (Ser/Thr protein kinase)